MGQNYQLLPPLKPEEFDALRIDIEKRGVQEPIHVDEDGNILDGHNREKIAKMLDKPCKRVVKRFRTEAEKREHVLKQNLCRRHLKPHEWGLAFKKLLTEKGVPKGGKKAGRPAKNRSESEQLSIGDVAKEVGVSKVTAHDRLKAAAQYEGLTPSRRQRVDSGHWSLGAVVRERGSKDRRKSRPSKTDKVATLVGEIYRMVNRDWLRVNSIALRKKVAELRDLVTSPPTRRR